MFKISNTDKSHLSQSYVLRIETDIVSEITEEVGT